MVEETLNAQNAGNVKNAGLALAAAAVLAGLMAAGSALFLASGSPTAGASEATADAGLPDSQSPAPGDVNAPGMTAGTGAPVADPVAEAVPSIVTPPSGEAAPDFRGIVQWINSPPLSLAELQGKVVLIDFWTYSCINCQRTLPYVRDWHDKYSGLGLVVVGVHSPEFGFEKDEDNVREAVAEQQVTWPVAMDNDFRTWRAYENRWWPHKFLIDRDGAIRYHHIGEGAYLETELHIRNLLVEAGQAVSGIRAGSGIGGG